MDSTLLVIDASEGVTAHDQRLAEEIVDEGRACVVVLNKWDLIPEEPTDRQRLEAAIAEKLRFLSWAGVVRTCALTNRGVHRVTPALVTSIDSHRRRLPTSTVNRVVREAQQARPHPRSGGRAVKILYAVQADVSPPTVILFSNARLDTSYVRFVENRIRALEPFEGSPLHTKVRVKTRH